MASITTALVNANAQPLAPGPVAGQDAAQVTIVNLDTANTVQLGSSATFLPYPLGPLASVTLTAPVWASAADQLTVGILPGGSAFSPGSLNISGPVTAEITGPIEVEGSVSIAGTPNVGISGTVDVVFPAAQEVVVNSGSVSVNNTPTVTVGSGNVTVAGEVNIGNTPAVTIESGAVTAEITGNVDVVFPSAQEVVVNSGSVSVSNTVATTVSNNVSVENAAGGSLTVAGEVNIGNTPAVTINSGSVTAVISGTPAVTIESGSVTANISGTPTIELAAGSEIEINNANIDVIGAGGFIMGGQTAQLFSNTATVSATPGASTAFVANANVSTFNSLDCSFGNFTNTSAAATSAMCAVIQFEWLSVNGNFVAIDTVSFILGSDVTYSIPCKGAKVDISLFNVGSVGNVQVAAAGIIIDGNARSVDHLTVTSYNQTSHTFAGLTLETHPEPAGLVNGWVSNIANATGLAAGTVFIFPLIPYNGQVDGWYQVVTDALDNDAVIIDITNATVGGIIPGTGNNGLIQNLPSAVQSVPFNITYFSPPSQLALIVKPSSASGALFLTLTGQG